MCYSEMVRWLVIAIALAACAPGQGPAQTLDSYGRALKNHDFAVAYDGHPFLLRLTGVKKIVLSQSPAWENGGRVWTRGVLGSRDTVRWYGQEEQQSHTCAQPSGLVLSSVHNSDSLRVRAEITSRLIPDRGSCNSRHPGGQYRP